MDWISYLFRLDGRINRASYWFGLLYLCCIMGLLVLLGAGLGLLLARGPSFTLAVEDVFRVADPALYRWPSAVEIPLLAFKASATALLLWVYLALSIKRLHDRDKSAWWIVPFFVVPGLYSQIEDRLPDSLWILPFALSSLVLSVWGSVEIGFLRGTSGNNQFGPDPLDPEQSRARTALPPWDQQSELELVPRRASPPDGMHVKRGA